MKFSKIKCARNLNLIFYLQLVYVCVDIMINCCLTLAMVFPRGDICSIYVCTVSIKLYIQTGCLREAAKKSFQSGPTTKTGGGVKGSTTKEKSFFLQLSNLGRNKQSAHKLNSYFQIIPILHIFVSFQHNKSNR